MATIRVSGSLESVKQQLMRIAAIVRGRKNDGWTSFLDDEVWEYFTEQDDLVCPVCEGFGQKYEFTGPEIKDEFTEQMPTNYSDTMYRHRAPNVHIDHVTEDGSPLRGKCRCNMFWRDGFMTLVNRLGREMEMVA